jgi:hypothetical protein
MRVRDHNKFRLFDYNNHSNDNFELGQIVINIKRWGDDGNPIGVVIQTHDDGDCRTDMFGNCSTEEVRLATIEEIKEFREELLDHIENY